MSAFTVFLANPAPTTSGRPTADDQIPVATAAAKAYARVMDERSHPDDASPSQAWLDALDEADADLAEGRTESLANVLAELQASLDRVDGANPAFDRA